MDSGQQISYCNCALIRYRWWESQCDIRSWRAPKVLESVGVDTVLGNQWHLEECKTSKTQP